MSREITVQHSQKKKKKERGQSSHFPKEVEATWIYWRELERTEEPQRPAETLGRGGVKLQLTKRSYWMRASNMIRKAKPTVHYQGESMV